MIKKYTTEVSYFFDLDKEYERIKKNFAKNEEVQYKLFKLLYTFKNENWFACYEIMLNLGYDDQRECDIAEYVHPFIEKFVDQIVFSKLLGLNEIGVYYTYHKKTKFIGTKELKELPDYSAKLSDEELTIARRLGMVPEDTEETV